MKHQVQHTLDPQAARDVLDSLVETYKQHYAEIPVASDWPAQDRLEFEVKVRGRQVQGTVHVCADCYDFEVDLPWALRPFKGKIASVLDREVTRWAEARAAGPG